MRPVLLSVFALMSIIMYGQQRPSSTYQDLAPSELVPLKKLGKIDNDYLQQKELSLRKKGRADQFAKAISVDIDQQKDGLWEENQDGAAIWRMHIESKGAFSLNFGFSTFKMPEGGKLYIYTDRDAIGPFTHRDNKVHNELWTPVLAGDMATIEVVIPKEQKKSLALVLDYVNHDYMNVFSSMVSGSCNVDVVCGAADGYSDVDLYRDIIRSVGAYTLNGISQCSGALINNTAQDCRPYFLTADHCNVTTNNDHTVVVYWNYENSFCRTPGSTESGSPGDGRRDQFNTGARLVANYSPSDMALLELENMVDPEFNPFFAGWNRRSQIFPNGAVAIHHPRVEEKRISFDEDPLGWDITAGLDTTHVVVMDWDLGTTEGGSSGSPLFDRNKLIIGQLTGGNAACGNDESDVYGWIKRSWEGGGTPQTRLRDWLDPLDIGITTLDGKACSHLISIDNNNASLCTNETSSFQTTISANNQFDGPIQLSLEGDISSIAYGFQNNPINPGEESILELSNLNSLESGNYQIDILADDGINEAITTLVINIENGTADNISAVFPSNEAVDINNEVIITWIDHSDSADFQLSLNPNFTEIVEEKQNILSQQVLVEDLMLSTDYYWRVRGYNSCGQGEWTSGFRFTTGSAGCSDFVPDDLPMNISVVVIDTVISEIEITQAGTITEVNLNNIVGRHTWIADISLILQSPSGTKAVLLDQICEDQEDFDLGFSDQSQNSTFACPPNDKRVYKPQESLDTFIGESSQGVWSLILIDNVAQDGGSLDNWELDLCILPSTNGSISLSQRDFSICDEESISLNVTNNTGQDLTISLEDNTGVLTTSSANNSLPSGQTSQVVISNLRELTSDFTEVILTFSNPNTSIRSDITIQKNVADAVDLIFPTDQSENIVMEDEFSWGFESSSSGYVWQLAEDSLFREIVYSLETNSTAFSFMDALDSFTKYFWRVLTKNQCGLNASDVYSFTSGLFTSVHELSSDYIRIFPNPVTNNLHIEAHALAENEILTYVIDINGRILFNSSIPIGKNHLNIDMKPFPDGMYIIRLDDGESQHFDKIVVQK